MKRALVVTLVAALFCTAVVVATGQDAAKPDESSFWMKKKLTYSQGILDGLATQDYDKIHKNAKSMKDLQRIEKFVRRKPKGYRTQLQIFQLSLDELVRHAENEEIDGATLAFTQMTISCVNCHKELRKY